VNSARGETHMGELLWEIQKQRHTFRCELHDDAQRGMETRIVRDGKVLIRQQFEIRGLAGRWAEEERKALEKKGSA
jgi:hypothetical protein